MANGLERKVSSSGIPLTENVLGLMRYEYAGVAKNLADAKDFAGARAALDKYALGTGDYENLHIAIEALAVSPEATMSAAKLYSKKRDEIVSKTTGLEFISYLEQCESIKMTQLTPGERKLFNIRMKPIYAKTIGAVEEEMERAQKILKETKENETSHPENVVSDAMRIYSTYGSLIETIQLLLKYNDESLALKSRQSALDGSGKNLKKVMFGFNLD